MKNLLYALFLLINLSAYSQYIITGKITDAANEALPYASVYLQKSYIGASADENGAYTLEREDKGNFNKLDTLVVSYIGFKEQRLPVYFGTNKQLKLDVKMYSSDELLEEITITTTNYSPEEIIKRAVKNIKKNYVQENMVSDGFYRELLTEDNKCIELNEAVIKVNYESYPQKNIIKKGFNKYWSKGRENPDGVIANVFYTAQNFIYFVAPKDEVAIVSSRVSNNLSKSGLEVAPAKGPAGLLTFDKVKFQYDFLDPKLFNKYNYKLVGKDYIDNELCYVLSFYPKKEKLKRVHQPINKKMKFALFTGRIYISAKEYAVLSFKYQLSDLVDFRVYNNSQLFSDNGVYEVKYKKTGNKYRLDRVVSNQRNILEVNKRSVLYTCERTLQLNNTVTTKELKKMPNNQVLDIMYMSSLRYFSNTYDSAFWNTFKKTKNYPELNKHDQSDLEKHTPLAKQFEYQNITIDSLPIPKVTKKEYIHVYTNGTKIKDDYHWLSKEKDTNTINYLRKENSYSHDVLHRLKNYNKLYSFSDIYKKDTTALKTKKDKEVGDYYWEQDELGDQIYYKVLPNSQKERIFNRTNATKGVLNYRRRNFEVKKQYVVYNYTKNSGLLGTLIAKPIGSDKVVDSIANVSNFISIDDSKILYIKQDATGREFKVFLHNLGDKEINDELLFWEEEETFGLAMKKTVSKTHLVLVSQSKSENENYIIDLDKQLFEFKSVSKRKKDRYYIVEQFTEGPFYTLVKGAENKIVRIPVGSTSDSDWQTMYTTKNVLQDLSVTKDYIAVAEDEKTRLKLKYFKKKQPSKVKEFSFKERYNFFDFGKSEGNTINVNYETPLLPFSERKLNIETEEEEIISEIELNENRSKEGFVTKLEWAKAKDGTEIPITLFYNKYSIRKNSKGVYVKAYGAYRGVKYGSFSANELLLAQQGFIVAYIHTRGHETLGQDWYNQGRLLNKKNTFEDYISGANYLKDKYEMPTHKMVGYGVSAGGLIMGYTANNYPNLFGTLILDRPYLDVINSMANKDLPLTTTEYKEWGNPTNKEAFDYMLSYSPYQNIKKQAYPNMLFYSGYLDVQTPYWQVAKSVAKYRENNTSKNLILMKTGLTTSHIIHFTESDNRAANIYAFIMNTISKGEKVVGEIN